MRTIEDFVTEQICKDRNLEQIRSIAISTRWSGLIEKVEETYNRLCAPLPNKEVA